MKKLLLLSVLCLFHFLSFSQENINKTDTKGMKQGKWVSRYPGGSLKYEGAFEQNKPVGVWKRYHENGATKALMYYRPNSERVSASLFDDKGTLYAKGVFEGSLRDSTWNFFIGEKLIRIENYKLGKKEGKSIGFDRDGKVNSEKEWKNDSPEGKCVDYYPGGAKRSEVTFQGGKRNGPAIFYDENGVVSMDGKYAADLSDGDWNVYDKEGKRKYVIKYSKGEIVNKEALDSMQLEEFTKYEKARGQIPEPKVNENGMPERQ
jgi:antitoxin component YwqK of YwqJK toxin-antitoxin module